MVASWPDTSPLCCTSLAPPPHYESSLDLANADATDTARNHTGPKLASTAAMSLLRTYLAKAAAAVANAIRSHAGPKLASASTGRRRRWEPRLWQ
eukprot:g34317.t1